jgi:hypothetical protein
MRTLHSILFVAAAAFASACTGSAQIHSTAEVDYVQPQLVEVEPGVQVVADYDQPVFFSDGAYWRYDAGVWYQSRYHDRAWVRVEAPPVAVRHVEHPEVYVHYRGHAEARDARREAHDANEVRHDEHEMNHEQSEVAHDRQEIRRDDAKGNEHAEEHDRKELKHDEKEEARERKELNKDEKRREKDERKEEKDAKHGR